MSETDPSQPDAFAEYLHQLARSFGASAVDGASEHASGSAPYHEAASHATPEEPLAATEKTERMASEIAAGADPWATHIKYNERNTLNPIIVGFYQDKDGNIRSVYGPKHFQSRRNVRSTIFASHTPDKEVNLLEGEFVQVPAASLLKGSHWNALPSDLREHFERGEILITTRQDVYAAPVDESVVAAGEPTVPPEAFDERIRAAAARADYFLLHYSDHHRGNSGRTGVIMTAAEGEIRPLIITIEGRGYIVEVKGSGTKYGGFGGMHSRTGREIVTGGAEALQAEQEIQRLEEDTRPGTPMAVGSILFTNSRERDETTGQPYRQGYIIRLSPSTVRASYTGIQAYPDIEAPDNVNRVLQMSATELVEHMFGDPPKILDRSSHTENILIWGDGRSCFTDYSDHVAFADRAFPHHEDEYMAPRQMLDWFIDMVREVPGYRGHVDRQKFLDHLTTALREKGVDISLSADVEPAEIAEKIWEHGMAYQVYQGRKAGQYIPEGVLREFSEEYYSVIATRNLPRTSEDIFVASETRARKNLLKAIKFCEARFPDALPSGTELEAWRAQVREGTISELEPIAEQVRTIRRQNEAAFTHEEFRWFGEKTGYYGAFRSLLTDKFTRYFAHELDVVTAARLTCPEHERAELDTAIESVQTRMAHMEHLVNTDLRAFYRLINSPDNIRKFLSFDFYGHV